MVLFNQLIFYTFAQMETHFQEYYQLVTREEKERLLQQHGRVIWFTGLSGSGKSTLAMALETKLYNDGILTCILDGDIIRKGLNSDLGFSEADRTENIRRIAEVSRLFCQTGIVVITSFISPLVSIRQMAREIIGNHSFFEIYLSTPLEECEKRDPKGLYKKARNGEIAEFTGITAPYEAPINPDIILDTSELKVEECVEQILQTL